MGWEDWFSWDWFKFGVVRGVLGLVIALIALGIMHEEGLLEMCNIMLFVNREGVALTLIVAIAFALLLNGFFYGISYGIVRWYEIHHILGRELSGIVAVIVVAGLGYGAILFIESIFVGLIKGHLVQAIVHLPYAIGIEIIMAILTYVVYEFAKEAFGWRGVEELHV